MPDTTGYMVEPMPGRVAVKLVPVQEMTDGGIYIPDTARDVATQGVVYAVCEEYLLDGEQYAPLFTVGDIVLFAPYTGTRITVGRDQVVVLKEKDVTARLVPCNSLGQHLPVAERKLIKVND